MLGQVRILMRCLILHRAVCSLGTQSKDAQMGVAFGEMRGSTTWRLCLTVLAVTASAALQHNVAQAASIPGVVTLGSSRYPCTQAGLVSALMTLSSGGIADGSACTGTIAATGSINISSNHLTLRLGAQTWKFDRSATIGFNVTGNNVIIQGKGPQSIITGAALGTRGLPSASLVSLNGVGDEIRHCQLQGQVSANQGSAKLQIGVVVANKNQKVLDNLLTGDSSSTGLTIGVDVNGSNGAYVERNTIKQIRSGGLAAEGFGVLVTGGPTAGGFIRGNHIVFLSDDGQHQIYVSQLAGNFDVSDNLLEGGVGDQIKLSAFYPQNGTGCHFNNIHHNILQSTNSPAGGGAINVVGNCSHNRVADNIINTPTYAPAISLSDGGQGARPTHNDISGNRIINPGAECIILWGADYNIIRGNSCSGVGSRSPGNYEAIVVQGHTGSNTSNYNQVIDNSVSGTSHKYALRVYSISGYPTPIGTAYFGNTFSVGTAGFILDQGSSSVVGTNNVNGARHLSPSP